MWRPGRLPWAGSGTYARLSEEFIDKGITSLRMDYRQPNSLSECALDLLVGVSFLKGTGYDPVVLVGHSFGGAVVIAARRRPPPTLRVW